MDNIKLIQSVTDYLKWIERIRALSQKELFPYEIFYYRGHADSSWQLKTSLHRNKIDEYDSIQIASKRTWSIIPQNTQPLEKLITFQHHGLYTRLLDVTTNPLVALFFACQSVSYKIPDNIREEYKTKLCKINCTEKDGFVYYGKNNKTEYLDTAIAIAHIISKEPSIDIVEKSNIKKWNQKYYKGKGTLSFDSLSQPHFIAPPITTTRIINQQGAFIMTPLIEKKQDMYTWVRDYVFSQGGKNAFFEKQVAKIPAYKKRDILNELDKLGINQSTIFPDIDNILSYINQQCRKQNFDIDLQDSDENMRIVLNKNYRAIIFDLDNTLIYTDKANSLAYSKAIHTIIEEKLTAHFGNQERFTRKELKTMDFKLDTSDIQNIIDKKEICFEEFCDKTKLNNQVAYLLDQKPDNCQYVLCTNASKKRALQLLEYYNIRDKFDLLIFKEDIAEGKNKYEIAISQLDIQPEEVVTFENEDNETENAKRLGINTNKI